jgi:hypothetical protein
MHDIHYIVLVFLISILVASLMHRPILRIAIKYRIYDNPDALSGRGTDTVLRAECIWQ